MRARQRGTDKILGLASKCMLVILGMALMSFYTHFSHLYVKDEIGFPPRLDILTRTEMPWVNRPSQVLITEPLQLISAPAQLAPVRPPAVAGSSSTANEKANLSCPYAEKVVYWHKITEKERLWNPPAASSKRSYVTFEPDHGGWNNIRMQMETVVVFAVATKRILVLPPDQRLYLLDKDHADNEHGFADFFNLTDWTKRLEVISMHEFLQREVVGWGDDHERLRFMEPPPGNRTNWNGANGKERKALWSYLENTPNAFAPHWDPFKHFVIFPKRIGELKFTKHEDTLMSLAGANRIPVFYNQTMHDTRLVHFITRPLEGYRLLIHFYSFFHFVDPFTSRYVKRLVRDSVHYVDEVFCTAALIVNALEKEAGGEYSAYHIRRGDFQYKDVKLPGPELFNNTGYLFKKGEVIFMATDERDLSYFKPWKDAGFKLRFLHDFEDLANLKKVNKNYFGMIDQVVAAKGRIFVGTWFSTFTGYITRIRGYLGKDDLTNYYGTTNKLLAFHKPDLPRFPFYMREWNVAWRNIDEV